MNRRVAVFLLIGFLGVFLLLTAAAISFAIGTRHGAKKSGTTPKLRTEVVDRMVVRKPARATRSRPVSHPVFEEDFPNTVDVTNWSEIAPTQTIQEMRLRAETYERLQRQYLDAQVALQQERNRQIQLQNERDMWKQIETNSKGPICRLHREEYCLSCWSVNSGFSK